MMGMTDFQNIETDKSASELHATHPRRTAGTNTAIDSTEMIFGIIFTSPVRPQSHRDGVRRDGTGLRACDPWNCLDFAVLVKIGAIELIAGAGAGLSGLRTAHPATAQSVNKVPGLQVLRDLCCAPCPSSCG